MLDCKRHLFLFSAAYISGVILFYRPENIWPVFLFLIWGSIFLIIWRHPKRKEKIGTACVIAAIFLFSVFRCDNETKAYETHLGQVVSGTQVLVTGKLYKKQFKSNNYLYYLKKTRLGSVLIYTKEDCATIGSMITVSGKTEVFPEARNKGNFDLSEYYKSQNIVCRVWAKEIIIRNEPQWNLREKLYKVQQMISQVYEGELNQRDAGVLGTLVLGNRALLEDDTKQLYQKAGVSHILAISGLHISILGQGVFWFLRKRRVSYVVSAMVGGTTVFLFVLMSGMGLSAVRAMIMYFLMLGAQVLGRTTDGVISISLAAFVILVIQPQALFQGGFQFSFMAMLGIQFSMKIMSQRQEKRRESRRKTEKVDILDHFLSGAILQSFLMPLTAWHYYEVPVYALFINLLILPLCGCLLGVGLLGGVAGIFFPGVSKLLLIICHFILNFYDFIIEVTNRLPFCGWITGKPNIWILFFYYFFLIISYLTFLSKKTIRIETGKTRVNFQWFGKCLRVAGYVFSGVFLWVILCFPRCMGTRIDFLDVSQGDCIHLTDGAGCHVMIDGGSSDESQVGKYRIEPFLKYYGVRKVDAWIISHGDRDHCSGVLELLESGYPIEHLLLAEQMPDSETKQKLLELAEDNNTQVDYMKAGDAIAFKNCELKCIYPGLPDESESKSQTRSDARAEMALDENNLSQVWKFQKEKMSALFTGDIGSDVEKILVEEHMVSECTVLKAAHHGSKNSTSQIFLERVRPKYSIISAGEGNCYGHPHMETIDRLRETGSSVVQTKDFGQITLYEKHSVWHMYLFLQEL